MKNGIKMLFAGKRELFDFELQELMRKLEDKTRKNKSFTFNFCMAYGGRQEIVEACRETVEKGEKIDEKNLNKNMWITNSPDLIIRTGGDNRTSNFLPWQSVYSEWIFLEKTWPEFQKEDLFSCIEEFKKRERRFGK